MFEQYVRKWELECGQTLDPDIKMSILTVGMVFAKIKDHLDLNASRIDTLEKFRSEILNLGPGRRRCAPDLDDDPMGIGAGKG